MGLFKSFGNFIGRKVEAIGNFFGSEKISQVGRNIQDACSETSRKVSETREYNKQSASVGETVNISEILSGFSIGLQAQADTIERNCILESQNYFNDLIRLLENKKSHINTNRIKSTLKGIKNSIKGSLKNHLAKRVSLDDKECLQILQMSAGKEKEKAMQMFGKKVINEALNTLSDEIASIVSEQNDEIKEFFEDDLEKQEKELSTMQAQFDVLAKQAEGQVLDKENAKLTPLILISVSDIVMSQLA